ncbi:MAG TPA: PfaB family protein, partial [Thioploca sp.]|nr:PfaB family protein [Thioploca sp.]
EGGNVAVIVAMGTELALHQFRGRCDLSWQIKASLAQANMVLSPEKIEELEAIAKNSLSPPAQLNQYTSFIGNIMATRVATQWNFNGPAFTVSAEENSVFSALEVAQQFLDAGEVDAVVVGAVDLAGGFEHVLLRHQLAPINSGVNTLSYDEKANGWMVGEGAGAVVLKRVDTAQTAQDRIYAVIDAISLMPSKADSLEHLPKTPIAETVTQSCQQAFDLAGIKATDIGYMEVFGSGVAQEDEAEIKGLTNAYQNDSLTTAIGSVKANIGHTYAASGMASLIKTALCLYHRYIPAVPQWENPKNPEQWQGSPFYVATESKTWFLEEAQTKRVAAINGLGFDGTYAHLILSEDRNSKRSEAELCQYLQKTPFYLFPLAADNQSALLKQLNELQNTIEKSDNLGATASQTFATFQNQPEANYRLSIVGHHKNELRQQIGFAMQGIKKAFATGKEWKTPLGSYFTAKPLAKLGKVAFVYPGMGSTYIGVGRELFRLYPKIDATFSTLSNHIGKLINDKLLYPRCLEKLSTESQQALETQLSNNGVAMCQTGISFDVLHTSILRDYFRIQPQASYGYSMGEVSGMMFALGVWRDDKMLTQDLTSSPLFQTQLTGPCFTARKLWGLPLDWNNPPTENFWCSYVLRATATAVKEILKHEERVYLTFINTPEEVIIGGDPDGCLRVIKTLKCAHFLINFNSVSHCEVAKSEYEALVNLHTTPVHKVADITFYSATDCAPMPFNTHYMGHNAAKIHCQTLDFPAITNRIYKDGVRVFIELGAGNNCARWIDKTLKGKEHVAMSINTKGVDDHTGIVKVLAKLVSHRVSMDLSPLYPTLEKDSKHSKKRKSLTKKIILGGKPIHTTILTDENRKSFENQIISHSPMLKIIQLQIAVSQQSHNDPLSVQANSSHRQPTLVTAPPSSQKPVIDLNAEVVLDSTIQPKNTPWAPVTEPRSIFLTGATGFLGTFLLYELLHQTQADIYCLVRSPNVHFGQMRIQNNLASYFSLNEDFHSRIVPVLGDLSEPLLGLSSEQFQRMANQIDTIYHCAAWLNWVAPYSQLKTINVLGTQEILRLAAQVKIKPVHYISTIAVFESSAYYQQVVTESDPLVHSEEIYLGYSQSKWVAEKLVMVARDRGFPVCIYRPPLISGHSQTGVWNTDDVTCKIIKGCIQMGHVPEFNYLFDVSPVDYVSRAIVYLSKQPEALGKAFHLNNPNPLHHNQFIDFINSFGYPLRQIPYENWLTLLNQDTAGLPENPVAPLLPFFAEKWSETQITIPQVYEITRKPQLSYQNTLAKLVGTSIVCPPVDAKLLHTYFSYFIRSGFLDAPTKSPDKSRAILHTVTGDVSDKNTLLKGDLGVCKQVVWDEADLLEFAEGKIANVFGPEYAIIDSYSRRVRLPLPPYLLVSRVTKLNAEKGSFKPCTLTTEYDIPHNMWYLVDGQIPWAVAVESGQCDLLLISYLGIDFDNKGVLVYRLLDCTMTFLEDIPKEGDTLRYDISINSFVKHGNNLLFFFSYECFVGDKMVLTMEGGCAGFFTDDELDKGKGVVYSKKELIEREKIQKQQFEPLLICQKSSFDETDMIRLTEGNLAACFGDHYWQAGLNPSLRIPPKDILMIDRVTSVEFNGGAYGLGLLVGEKVLEP